MFLNKNVHFIILFQNNDKVSVPQQTSMPTLTNMKRKSRMSLSTTTNMSSLKRNVVSENPARAKKTSSTVSRLQRNLNRYIAPDSRILKKIKGFGCRSPLQYDGGALTTAKTKQETGEPLQSSEQLNTSKRCTTTATQPSQHSDVGNSTQTKPTVCYCDASSFHCR